MSLIGWVLLTPLDLHGPAIEIGWRLIRAAWGRATCRRLRDRRSATRSIRSGCSRWSPTSIRRSVGVARKLGLRPVEEVRFIGSTVIRYVAGPSRIARRSSQRV